MKYSPSARSQAGLLLFFFLARCGSAADSVKSEEADASSVCGSTTTCHAGGQAMLQAKQSRSDVVPTASSPGLISVHEDSNTPVTPEEVAPPEEVDEGGIGLSAPINEAGYQAVAATCCPLQMDFFIHRVIASLGLEMCYEGGLQGFLGWFTCDKGVTSYANMEQNLLQNVPPAKCAFVAPGGTCPPPDPTCLGVDEPWRHRRRRCATTTMPLPVAESTTLTASPTR